LECLNELVTDALELVPDCLAYLTKLNCAEIFRFCAIPQVMAIATLDRCYSNPNVFTGVVKIRKGLSCKLILRTKNLDEVHDSFYQFAYKMLRTAETNHRAGIVDPSYARTLKACQAILDLTAQGHNRQLRARRLPRVVSGLLLAALGIYHFCEDSISSSVFTPEQIRGILLAGAVATCTFGPSALRQSSSLQSSSALNKP
jgi:farnesyl-diphosphate farnesyltransferase